MKTSRKTLLAVVTMTAGLLARGRARRRVRAVTDLAHAPTAANIERASAISNRTMLHR